MKAGRTMPLGATSFWPEFAARPSPGSDPSAEFASMFCFDFGDRGEGGAGANSWEGTGKLSWESLKNCLAGDFRGKEDSPAGLGRKTTASRVVLSWNERCIAWPGEADWLPLKNSATAAAVKCMAAESAIAWESLNLKFFEFCIIENTLVRKCSCADTKSSSA